MPDPIYMKLKDKNGNEIKGSVVDSDPKKKESIKIQAVSHSIELPTDPLTGVVKGTRRHRPIIVTKEVDASSPVLLQSLCYGRELKEVKLYWYKNVGGKATQYYTIRLVGARIVNIKTYFPNCLQKETEDLGHMEDVAINYAEIEWTYEEGGVSGGDNGQTKEE